MKRSIDPTFNACKNKNVVPAEDSVDFVAGIRTMGTFVTLDAAVLQCLAGSEDGVFTKEKEFDRDRFTTFVHTADQHLFRLRLHVSGWNIFNHR